MTTTAKADIYNRTLKKLGVLGRNQTASATDTADMTAAYNELYAKLDRKSLISWDTDDEIPDEFSDAITALMAKSRLDEYGVNLVRRQSILSEAATGMVLLAELHAPPLAGETEHEYF